MNRLDKTEIIFKVIAYLILVLFALACIYPLLYALFVSISDEQEVAFCRVTFFPRGFNIKAYKSVLDDSRFWMAYCNTLFYAFYGTLVSMVIAIT